MNNIPSNINLEKVVLGSFIENPNLYYSFAYRINSSLFSAIENRQIFEVISDLQDKNKPIDKLLIQNEISRKKLDLNNYLAEIVSEVVSTNNFEHYLTSLLELSAKRDFIDEYNRTKPDGKSKFKDIWTYSGYTFEEIIQDEKKIKLLKLCDVLIDGKFEQELLDLKLKFRGSSNQRILNVRKSLEKGYAVDYYK